MTIHPYYGVTFGEFFIVLFQRLWLFVTGNLSFEQLAPDEIQLLTLSGIAFSSALLGTFLVLRKMTMLANSLSHTILLGIALAFIWGQSLHSDHEHLQLNLPILMMASLAMGLLTTFLTESLTRFAGLQEDASIGLVFTALFALGIICVTLWTRNAHIGTEAVMGNVDALQLSDCALVWGIAGWNILITFLFFKEFSLTTFDPGFARAIGINPLWFNYLLMIQTSLTVVGAFRAVGVLMILAFLTAPVLAARLCSNRLIGVCGWALLIGIASATIGVAFARHLLSVYGLALSTAGLVVSFLTLVYLLIALLHPRRGLLVRYLNFSKTPVNPPLKETL